MKYSLVILAAGIGSRFGSGIKQLTAVGPSGELIIDYSIHDAIEAGFNNVVFIIRRDLQDIFREIIGERVERECAQKGITVEYAFQEVQDLPAPYTCPEGRTKPWGTGHALLACRDILKDPFVIINADDYYGKEAFGRIYQYLSALPEGSTGNYCMAGFLLGNTLSEHGGVTRGICETDGNGHLSHVYETKNIIKTPEGAAVMKPEGNIAVDPGSFVSMNMWGFTPDVMDIFRNSFVTFLKNRREEAGSEFLIPVEIENLLTEGTVSVSVLPTNDRWFGVTYHEDTEPVRESFRQLVADGVYASPLNTI